MGLPYRTEEQKARWNEYTKRYNKSKYKTITVKIDKVEESDLITFLESSPDSIQVTVKKALKHYIEKEGK